MEERNYKTFVVSSASVGDGKTTVAINWADTAAVMGQKVLLIDANFRKPEIHEFLNLHNQSGFVDLLKDPTQEVAPYVQRVFENRELFVLPPGKSEDDIARLLNSDRLGSVMAHLEQEFDLIILDIPSMLGLADATLFSRNTDALILVASLHKTKLGILEEAVDELEKKQIPVLGLVVNRQKGAVPVLRATIGQSSTMNYFPEVDDAAPENRSLITADVEVRKEHFTEQQHHSSNGDGNGQLAGSSSEEEKEESVI
ncbi:CpsD/CapB family tyrosine-protein kinase [[Limnothrix rosea] IAM M-220]|uniref:CpsD/CapB family tyrosine-protein kinase n=1 Tax=[Limnothrix rosea] IAM M-220 TaxID=454133 RepID=UPI000969A59F|nr:CpsD/CapB family tyrosine-protein kinase [[Limnothrix rosea] IAM M-220]OKH13184.1 hypothetical protein NIES208_15275 [[Limnothrix rosea] IAM M-220]